MDLGLDVLRLHPGGTTRINPFDAGPAADRLGPVEVAVRRKPDTVVNAVFPVIGPAIRRALVEALRHMASGLDVGLEPT